MLGRRLRVVVLEHEAGTGETIKGLLPSLFAPLGYQAEGLATIDKNDVEKYIMADRCDLLFSDLTLGARTRTIEPGLNLIRDVKRKYPHVFVIACSIAAPTLQNLIDRAPNVMDLCILKDPFLNNSRMETGYRYHPWLQKQVAEKFRIATDIDLEIHAEDKEKIAIRGGEYDDIVLTQLDVLSLIRQCLWSGLKQDSEFLPTIARASVLGEGRSGSLVLRVELSAAASGLEFVPVIVKISELDKAKEEKANFDRYVKLILPYNWRIDVLGYGETRDWGAIAYSVAFGGEKQISGDEKYQPLTKLLKDNNSAVSSIVDKVFGNSGNVWYNSKFGSKHENLGGHYLNKYFSPESKLNSCYSKLEELLTQCGVDLDNNDPFVIGGESYRSPRRVIFQHNRAGTMTVCHGDLNSNNIMVSDNNDITFIDFQETGRGHVFEDFVTLESSLRIYIDAEMHVAPSQRNLKKLIDAEYALVLRGAARLRRDDRALLPYASLVDQIRSKVMGSDRTKLIFPDVAEAEYWFALAAFHYRLVRMAGVNLTQRMRVAACMFAAWKRLSDLGAA